MPPWRTVDETRATARARSPCRRSASASSADLRCCTSKSGGTYSASITGVSGSTLTSRIVPSEAGHHQRGLDRGLGELRIGEVDRNQDLLVHGAVPPFWFCTIIATPRGGMAKASGSSVPRLVAAAAGVPVRRDRSAASERGRDETLQPAAVRVQLAQSSAAKSITASPAVGRPSLSRSRASTSPEAISSRASRAGRDCGRSPAACATARLGLLDDAPGWPRCRRCRGAPRS